MKFDKHESTEGLRKVKYVWANERKLKGGLYTESDDVKDKITAIGAFAVPILRYSLVQFIVDEKKQKIDKKLEK